MDLNNKARNSGKADKAHRQRPQQRQIQINGD